MYITNIGDVRLTLRKAAEIRRLTAERRAIVPPPSRRPVAGFYFERAGVDAGQHLGRVAGDHHVDDAGPRGLGQAGGDGLG